MADPENQPQPTSQGSTGGSVTINMSYLKSIKGILKIVEIFLLLVAFACAADVCGAYCQAEFGGRYSFFIFATVMPWLLCIIIFVMFFFCLVDKVKINWNMTVMINSAIWAIVLLIAASLWADKVNDWRKLGDAVGVKLDGGFYASAIFAFFAIIAFIIDIVMNFQTNRQ